MALDHRLYRLKGAVQHYSWGGFDFIPQLFGINNTEKKPFAEYWLGAHPNHPSLADREKLNELIQKHPEEVLGKRVVEKYSSLPYLLKILDVRQMLSIQVHPDEESAIIAFEKEEQKKIPVTAAHRNYKDKNHKPEMMVALNDFWLLHGFKKAEDLHNVLERIPEFNFLKKVFEKKNYKGLYEEVMTMDQHQVNEILQPLINRIIPLYQNNISKKDQEDYWAAKAALTFCKEGLYDRGIFSIYFFNLLHLKKGEGIFQPAGLPHAYLEGQNVEVMVNSDNVLRAGLTEKHIDVPELMRHVQFVATVPELISASSREKHEFKTPAEEFTLEEYHLSEQMAFHTFGAEIILVMDGEVIIESGSENLSLKKGEACFVISDTNFFFKPGRTTHIFRVYTPV